MKNLLVILLFAFGSCSHIYGLKRVRAYTTADIEQWNKAHGIEGNNAHEGAYKQRISEKIADKSLRKDLQQPLQYWIFDSGRLVSNMVNCDATGFPNLKWPIEENFRNKTVHARNVGPEFHSGFVDVQNIKPGNNTQIIVINYARFMGRQNKRFLKNCKRFLAAHPDVVPYYSNMDNVFANENGDAKGNN